jgi:hypothetical protein
MVRKSNTGYIGSSGWCQPAMATVFLGGPLMENCAMIDQKMWPGILTASLKGI